MPWCETCARFFNPNSLRRDGTCPACGRVVAEPRGPEAAVARPPWHFWVFVAAAVIYLGWRLVQGVAWLL
jgi:hypothetical protein